MFDPNVPVVIACAGICAVTLAQARLSRESLFTPLRMYLLTQAGTLGIAYLRMNPAMTPLRAVTWAVLIGSAISFSIGCLAANYGSPPVQRPFDRDKLRPAMPFGFLASLFGLLILASLASLSVYGKWPVFSGDPETDRGLFVFHSTWGMWSFGHETILLTLSVFLIFFSKPLWMRISSSVILAISFAIQILIGIRNPLLFAVFVALCMWDLGVNRLKTRVIALAGSGFLMVFVVVAFLRAKVIASLFRTTEEGTPFQRMFLPIYTYISNNYWNLDNSLEKWDKLAAPSFQYGLGMIQGILLPIVRIPTAEENGWLSLTREKTLGLNTLTYHWVIWQNGGMLLTILFPLFWGWAMTRLYRTCQASSNLLVLYLYAYLLFPIAFGFFSFYFVIGSYSLPALWILMLLPFGAGAGILGPRSPKQGRELAN